MTGTGRGTPTTTAGRLGRLNHGFLGKVTGVAGLSVVGQVVVYIVQIVLARLLGAEEYGRYAYVYNWIGLLVTACIVGFDTALVRFVAVYEANEDWPLWRGIVRFSRLVVSGLSTLLGAVVFLGAWLLPLSEELTATFWAGALMLPAWALHRLDFGVLQAMGRVAIGQSLFAIVRPLAWVGVVLVASYAFEDPTAWSTMVLHVGVVVAIVIIGRIAVHRIQPSEAREGMEVQRQARYWFSTSIPMSLVAGMRLIMQRLDIILVGVVLGTTDAGIYAVASRLSKLLPLGQNASNAVIGPRLARQHDRGDTRALQQSVTQSSWFATISVLAAAVVVVVGGNPLLGAFGAEFRAGRTVLLILSATQVVNAMTGPVGMVLNMSGHERVNSRILAVTLVLNVLLNYPAILLFGSVGAALVTGGLVVIKNLWTWWEVRNRLGVNSSVFGGSPRAMLR